MDKKVLDAIFSAIEELNRQLPADRKVARTPDLVIFGTAGEIDSLGFVTLIVAIEQKIEDDFGVTISLTDEKAMSGEGAPFRTIGTLAEYITAILQEKVSA